MAVNLKPTWVKGLYRLGCALQKCKQWKDSAAVFTKVWHALGPSVAIRPSAHLPIRPSGHLTISPSDHLAI